MEMFFLCLLFQHLLANMVSFPLIDCASNHDVEKETDCEIFFVIVEVGVLKENRKFTSAKKVSIIMENFLNLNFSERILSQNLFQVLRYKPAAAYR